MLAHSERLAEEKSLNAAADLAAIEQRIEDLTTQLEVANNSVDVALTRIRDLAEALKYLLEAFDELLAHNEDSGAVEVPEFVNEAFNRAAELVRIL